MGSSPHDPVRLIHVHEYPAARFLTVLAVFLLISAPFMLVGAYREGKRRRERRKKDGR